MRQNTRPFSAPGSKSSSACARERPEGVSCGLVFPSARKKPARERTADRAAIAFLRDALLDRTSVLFALFDLLLAGGDFVRRLDAVFEHGARSRTREREDSLELFSQESRLVPVEVVRSSSVNGRTRGRRISVGERAHAPQVGTPGHAEDCAQGASSRVSLRPSRLEQNTGKSAAYLSGGQKAAGNRNAGECAANRPFGQ